MALGALLLDICREIQLQLGPCVREIAYRRALAMELRCRGYSASEEVSQPVEYIDSHGNIAKVQDVIFDIVAQTTNERHVIEVKHKTPTDAVLKATIAQVQGYADHDGYDAVYWAVFFPDKSDATLCVYHFNQETQNMDDHPEESVLDTVVSESAPPFEEMQPLPL
jgi:hypothetical protein